MRPALTHISRWLVGLLVALAAGCTSQAPRLELAPRNPDDRTVVTHASLHEVDTATLPRLPRSQTAGLPARVPPIDADLPALLDDLPGRAVMLVNPSITVVGRPVESWSELEFLVYGVDGRWRRLNLGDLGLDESLRWYDTYGSGSLSSDGRWWTATTRDGSLLLNMRTGAVRLLSLDSGDWVLGRNAILTYGAETTMPGGVTTRVRYGWFTVGYEPDGTPLSLERGPDGEALLVEWQGATRHVRTTAEGLDPPRRLVSERRRSDGVVLPSQLTRVVATTDMVVSHGPVRGREKLALVAVDSTTGAKLGELTWERSDFSLYHDDWWLDEETLLIATRPHFLGWRPHTGEVFRVTDAHTVSDAYWDLTVASQVVSP